MADFQDFMHEMNRKMGEALANVPVFGPLAITIDKMHCEAGLKYINPAGCQAVDDVYHGLSETKHEQSSAPSIR